MNQLKIKSTHAKLAAAVEAANFDISYNPQVAWQRIKDADTGFNGRCHGTTLAFVTDDDEVWYGFKTEDGVNFLHKFNPFTSVLTDLFFRLAVLEADTLVITDTAFPNDKRGRAALATLCNRHPNWFNRTPNDRGGILDVAVQPPKPGGSPR